MHEYCDPFPDTDQDGLNDCEEAIEGTSAYLQDTDRDGLPTSSKS